MSKLLMKFLYVKYDDSDHESKWVGMIAKSLGSLSGGLVGLTLLTCFIIGVTVVTGIYIPFEELKYSYQISLLFFAWYAFFVTWIESGFRKFLPFCIAIISINLLF